MRRMPGYCENCYAVYETNGIVMNGINININIKNTVIGTCPTDGGAIRVVDGSYSLIDGILTLKKYDKNNEIVEIMRDIDLISLDQGYEELSRVLKSKEYDKTLVEKVLEIIKEILVKTKDFQVASQIFFGLMVILTFGYDSHEAFVDSPADKNTEELVTLEKEDKKDRNKIIREEEKQTKELKKQTKEEEKQSLELYLSRKLLEDYLESSKPSKRYAENHTKRKYNR